MMRCTIELGLEILASEHHYLTVARDHLVRGTTLFPADL